MKRRTVNHQALVLKTPLSLLPYAALFDTDRHRHPPMKSLLLTATLLLFSLHGTAAEPLKLNNQQIRSLGIEVQTLADNSQSTLKRLPGRVEVPAGQLQVVFAPVEGTLQEVLIAPGMPVRKGQLVARLVSPQALELQRSQAEASAGDTRARAALVRDEQLFREGIIAKGRLEATRAQAAEAAARLGQSSQTLAMSGGQAGRMGPVLELKASMDGLLLEQLAQAGQRLPAAAPIARIGRLQPLWVDIQVPRSVAAQVKVGDPVGIPVLGIHGKLLAVGRTVDPASQNVMLRAQVDVGTEALSPGQAVEVDIAVSGQTGQALPASALIRHAGGLLAFVQRGSGDAVAFEARSVRVLSQVGDTVLVSGLQAGERVVVHGVSSLKAMLLNSAGNE